MSKLNIPRKERKFGRFWRRLKILICVATIALCFGLSAKAIAQNSSLPKATTKATVVLDGRELIEIGGLGKLTASERANKISKTLQDKLRSLNDGRSQSWKVTIAKQSNWTVLRLGDRHLVTVGEAEVIPGMGIDEQASIWQSKIAAGLKRGINERSTQYRIWTVKATVIALILAVFVQAGLVWFKRQCRRKSLDAKEQKIYSWTILFVFVLQVSVWLYFSYYVANLFPLSRHRLYLLADFINRNFNAKIFDLGGDSSTSLRQITVAVLLGIGWWFFVAWLAQIFESRLLPLTKIENTLQNSIVIVARYGLASIGLLLILNSASIDFRSLAIVLSALGVGIGFGLQNIAKDFISGVILSITRPIKIGELVEVGDSKGLVLRIGVRTTDISHVDRHIMTIPNSQFIEETVKNWNRSGLNRVKLYVDVAYDSDRDLVYKALLSAAQVYHPDILKHPPPKVKFRNFGERSLEYRVVVFIKDPLKEPKVRNHIQLKIDQNFRKYQIEIPYPQRDVHFKVPQLEKLIANLVQIYTPPQQKIYYPNTAKKESIAVPTAEELTIRDEHNWDELIDAMHGVSGLEIKDRRYGLKTYSQVFTGSEAVSWLIKHEKATKAEAIAIGKLMIEQRIIHHVLDEHNFKDEALFYRFYIDEQSEEMDWESDDS